MGDNVMKTYQSKGWKPSCEPGSVAGVSNRPWSRTRSAGARDQTLVGQGRDSLPSLKRGGWALAGSPQATPPQTPLRSGVFERSALAPKDVGTAKPARSQIGPRCRSQDRSQIWSNLARPNLDRIKASSLMVLRPAAMPSNRPARFQTAKDGSANRSASSMRPRRAGVASTQPPRCAARNRHTKRADLT